MLFCVQLVPALVEKWRPRAASTTLHSVPGVDNYHSDLEFRRFCSMLDGLSFLPTEEVKEGMEHLKTVIPAEAAELVDYLDNLCLKQLQNSQGVRLRVVPPMYPPLLSGIYMRRHYTAIPVPTSFLDTVVQQDLIGNTSKPRHKRNAIQLQKRLRYLCQDRGSSRCALFSLTNSKIFSTSSPHFQTFLRDVTT
ncbi:hypothetical protein E2C01_014737 [Portunus trituberculatus]|uniref:Uncharacterized protein n=1 Tax=Portunus trituberculatus TaxID=210409 RepID=A0A5B7DJL6_PORTR|nr:hypothetical protein [Portunus trituberculatus]